MANGAAQDYRCFVATTTEYFALKDSDGEIYACRAGIPQVIPASHARALWPCARFSDPRPEGDVTALDCHGHDLTLLDVRRLAALKALDCSRNKLTELELMGLVSLENIYCDQNPFVALDLTPCRSLAFVGYTSRRLGYSESAISSLTGGLECHDRPLLWFHPYHTAGILNTTNDTICAEKYIGPRIRSITPEEVRIRDTAYALKIADPNAIARHKWTDKPRDLLSPGN